MVKKNAKLLVFNQPTFTEQNFCEFEECEEEGDGEGEVAKETIYDKHYCLVQTCNSMESVNYRLGLIAKIEPKEDRLKILKAFFSFQISPLQMLFNELRMQPKREKDRIFLAEHTISTEENGYRGFKDDNQW